MKKSIIMLLLFALLALTACGQMTPSVETPLVGGAVQIPNPWRDLTEAEAEALCPGSLRAPEGAENLRWSAMEIAGEPALVQLSFDLNGYSYTAREQVTNQAADISGMYYTWTAQLEMTLQNWEESAKSGTYYRYIGENEWADLCTWYDTAKGVSYSLSVTAKDLDGFDLQAIAEMLCASQSAAAETGRRDGERFEAVIILEGMEETVQYEHVRNDKLGFELDFDYERFERRSEADRECFISVWDRPDSPEHYLEVTASAENADAVAAAVRAELSQTYDLLEESRELDRAGACVYIEASVLKGTNTMADHLQLVYIIPAPDGCLIVTEHFSAEASEGFGRRFSYILNTLAVIDRSGEQKLSDEQALSAVKNYCYCSNPDLESIVNAGEYPVYWEIEASNEQELVVLFRSYTGALIRYHIDPISGETYVTEFVSGITPEEQRTEESFNARDYLLSLTGTWQTASIVFEDGGTACPEYHVRFTDSEILYGRLKDEVFVLDHADGIVSLQVIAAGRFQVQAEASNGVRYTYQTCESDPEILEYYETWNEAEFPAMYRGGASLSKCG